MVTRDITEQREGAEALRQDILIAGMSGIALRLSDLLQKLRLLERAA